MSQPKSQPPRAPSVSRRSLFAGAATVGAVAAAASLVPTAPSPVAAGPTQPAEPPSRGGGYSLTDHVRQYYKTTLV